MPEAPIALLQLARPDQILLIQLSGMRGMSRKGFVTSMFTTFYKPGFPNSLRDVLENYEIVKAGVGIEGDARKLWRDYGVSLLGAVELSQLARVSDPQRWGDTKPKELIR
jgi:hypothetical protein